MVMIRTLTPRSGPRLIVEPIEEPEIYFRRDEVWEHKQPATEFPIATSGALGHPHYDPLPTQEHDFAKPDHRGRRIFDFRLGCYVKEPPKPAPLMRRPKPSPAAWTDTIGDHFWITCRETGSRMVRIRAQTAAKAQVYAGLYAIAHQLPAAAAYALRD